MRKLLLVLFVGMVLAIDIYGFGKEIIEAIEQQSEVEKNIVYVEVVEVK